MSAAQPPRLPINRIDERLADPGCDLAGLAADLYLPVTQVEAFARVRRILLAGRTPGGGTDLTVDDLTAAGIRVSDISAYLSVAQHVHRLTVSPVQRPADDKPAR